jgi:hypothetical protein
MLSLGVLVYFLAVFSKIFMSRMIDIARPMVPPLLSGFVTFIVLLLLVQVSPLNVLALVALTLIGTGMYFSVLHISSKGRDVRDLIDLIRGSLLKRPSV